MTPLGLLAMRKAAALAFAVPGLEVDVANDDHVLVRVERRFDGRDVSLQTTLLSPCAFRSAIGRAHAHARSGGTAIFLGMANDFDPVLRYHMPFTGAVKPLGLIVSRVGETVVHVFATQRPIGEVEAVIRSVGVHPALADEAAVNASWDPVCEVTLVYSEVRLGLLPLARPVIEATMESLMVRFAVDEITQAVASNTTRAR